MKKIFLYGLLFFTASLGITSCSKDQHTDTKVTNFITLTINGDKFVNVATGASYVDAGCRAEAAGQDVSDKIVTNNPVDTKAIGPYTVTYKATNEDGFSSSATRTVYVGDPLLGNVSSGTNRKTAAGAVTNWSDFDIDMLTDGSGKYWVEDFLQVNADNTVDLIGGGHVEGWNDDYSDFKDGKYDPATKTISYTVVYAKMDFNVILTLNK